MHHDLKLREDFFLHKRDGLKPWEVRRTDDRSFHVLDTVVFHEIDRLGIMTGNTLGPFRIVYVLAESTLLQPGVVAFTHTSVPLRKGEFHP